MSDDADLAGDRQEKEIAAALDAAAQRAAIEAMKPLPVYCLNGCGEKARERSRYCCPECLEEAEFRARQQKRMGIR
jgi:hypothetical protein